MKVNWTEAPPPSGARAPDFWKVVAARADRPIKGVVLGAAVCCWLHWHEADSRTVPCQGDKCPYCGLDLPKRWKAYVPITGRLIVELPQAAYSRYLERLTPGQGIEIRKASHRAQPVISQAFCPELAQLPDPAALAETVKAVLLRLWRVQA